MKRIFFQGALAGQGMSGWQRCAALRSLGFEVVPLCQVDFLRRAQPRSWQRWLTGAGFGESVVREFNDTWLRMVTGAKPDLCWLEWPRLLRRETIAAARARLPECVFAAFYDDNPFGGRVAESWQWKIFFEAIPEYDLHLVKRPSDLEALRERGARRSELFMHGYFEEIFHPRARPGTAAYPVTFVGTALDHRVAFIHQLIAREKLPLTVFGNRWDRSGFFHLHRGHFQPEVIAESYADVLRGSRVSLAFVSSSNRDEYSMRTFEIPACGGFMLAERTATHLALFEEGKEAEFFSSVEECAEKARFYLSDEPARARVAQAGHRRCLESDYSLRRRLREALAAIEQSTQSTRATSVHI